MLTDLKVKRMERKAAKLGWNIPDIHKQAIVDGQVEIALDPAASPREKTSAAKCLVSMESQNIAISLSPVTTAEEKIEPVSAVELLAAMKATIPKIEE